jgi:hypothetical protein
MVSGDPIGVTVIYAGGVLNLTLTDAVAQVSFTTNFTVNIPTYVGSNTAYIGFTASTGANTAIQEVSNFSFFNFPTIMAQKAGGGTTVLTWPANEGFVLQQSSSLTGDNWVTNSATPTVVNGNAQVTVTNNGAAQFYRLWLPLP